VATSRQNAVINRLIAIWEGAFDPRQVYVADGPYIDQRTADSVVSVGFDGSEDGSDGEATNSDQEWVGLGTNNRRDEAIQVTCSALSWIGDNSPTTARARAYALVDACEAAVLADTTLGLGPPGQPGAVRNAMVSGLQLFQANNAGGAKARVVFTVSCTARL
jgi:hypothetical protein